MIRVVYSLIHLFLYFSNSSNIFDYVLILYIKSRMMIGLLPHIQ
jgi:hypothetical protein